MYGKSYYGTFKYGNDEINDNDISIYKPNLLDYLPPILHEIKEFKELDKVLDDEIALLNWNIKDVLNQCFIDTATCGLTLWEEQYGLNIDLNKSYEERREILKAKKRGQGTVTKKMIKETAEAFSGGEVDIIEHSESYSFIVKFIGIKGIPKNLAGFKDMLDTIKPAHLSYDFKYTYTIWNFLKEKNLNWNSANIKSWNDLKVFE